MTESFRNLFDPRVCGLCQARYAKMTRDRDGLPCCFECLMRAGAGKPAAEPPLTAEEEARRLEALGRESLAAARALLEIETPPGTVA